MDSRTYTRKKREKIDKCNICGNVSPLTWDHVPPKFCFNSEKVKYNKILDMSNPNKKLETSQNGVKFRSICDNCNNNLLGSRYDKEYKKLVDILYDIYIKPGTIAQYVEIQGLKINKVVRAIVGHLLAAKESYTENTVEKELREYFLDETKMPPKRVKLLYYVYIYNTIMIMRDFVAQKYRKSEYQIPNGFSSCINCFPLAFILVDRPDNDCGLFNIFDYCTPNIEEEVNIKIDLLSYKYGLDLPARNPFWPCNVSDEETGTSMILLSEDSQKHSVFSTIRDLKPKE